MKRNPNRTTSGIRKLFQSELQLWDKFGIKKKHRGEHFVPGVGYLFDFKKINKQYSDYKLNEVIKTIILIRRSAVNGRRIVSYGGIKKLPISRSDAAV